LDDITGFPILMFSIADLQRQSSNLFASINCLCVTVMWLELKLQLWIIRSQKLTLHIQFLIAKYKLSPFFLMKLLKCGDKGGWFLKGISRMGFYIGEWIFIIDAVDDYEHDIRNGNWNPFMHMTAEESKETALRLMIEYETQIDQIAALLPYKRDAGIISNIFQNGLPAIRHKVFTNQKLGRL